MILLEALWPPRTVLAILQTFMRNQGDAWTSTLGALKRILETAALTPGQDDRAGHEECAIYVPHMRRLGLQRAEMHKALATPTADPKFKAQTLSFDDVRKAADAARILDECGFARLRSRGAARLGASAICCGGVGDYEVEDYRRTADVRPDSTTETYVALKLMIDNLRWAGVPFYLRTGKALKSRRTEVAIKFKQAPCAIRDTPVDQLAENFLVMSIRPDECIGLLFNAKVPGPVIAISGVGMTFKYRDYFDAAPSTGYETLIYDCMIGDAILFQRADGIEAGRVVQPFLDAWRNVGPSGLAVYKAGSESPAEADRLLARDGRRWRPIA